MTTFSPAIDTNSFQTNDLLEKDVRRSVRCGGEHTVRLHITPLQLSRKIRKAFCNLAVCQHCRARCHRAEDEGRTPIRTVLQSTATLEPTDQELRVTLSPLSSPHRSQAVAGLCENLTTGETRLSGTAPRMRLAAAGYPQ